MSSRRKDLNAGAATGGLFRPREEIEQEQDREPRQGPVLSTSRDVSPTERRVKRASFDIYEDQIERLGTLKYRSRTKISDMVREALDEYLTRRDV